MRNAIRCCISCILPCGALDLIRIVHSDGRVEEVSGAHVSASHILDAHPKHVLKKPSDNPSSVPRIMVVPPDTFLKRGHFYFLVPVSEKPVRSKKTPSKSTTSAPVVRRQHQSPPGDLKQNSNNGNYNNEDSAGSLERMMRSDRYLQEVMREKASTQKEKRRGRVDVWRPHLESISESSAASSTTGDNQ